MKKNVLLLFFPVFFSMQLLSQEYRTGNTEFDASLAVINTDARTDMISFKALMKTEYQVSDQKINEMSVKLGMRPADIYFSLEIGKYSKRPIDEILVIYQKNKGKGWGEIAKACGIKPGSPEFHAMKSNASGKAQKIKIKKNPKKEIQKRDFPGNKEHPKKGGKKK